MSSCSESENFEESQDDVKTHKKKCKRTKKNPEYEEDQDNEDEDDQDNNEDDDDQDYEDVPDEDEEESEKVKDQTVAFPVINPFALIKNKVKRLKRFKKQKQEMKKIQKDGRKLRKQMGGKKSTGHTIESLREKDQTVVQNLDTSDNEELRKDLETDDFNEFYNKTYAPKVLITYSDIPSKKTRMFGKELKRIIPNAMARTRNWSSMKKMCKSAIKNDFTDLIVINENRNKANGMFIVHLPNGPTAHFKLSNVKTTKEIRRKYREITSHRPEVILTNFSTRLGLNIGRMLGSLFHHDPQFKGRRAVTFHNQRDYIFFRHHRYEFADNGQRVKLRELGPRFTMKLRSLQEGVFDTKCGDYEWILTNRHAMESRRRFFL